ncbi:MAG: apolipoprotein N-acyltransferase [Deltaproteobacteria bacterium]|nr:apolipoprotein N-acyltransferase [Deltaproteobacteria bacterium]
MRAQGWREACAGGAVFGAAVALAAHAPWVAAAGRLYFGLGPWLAAVAATALAVGCGAVYGSVLGAMLRCALCSRPAGLAAIAVGAAWAAWESLTTALFPYYPWAGLAATQTDLPTLQLVSVAGQGALSAVIAGAGACFGLAGRAGERGPALRRAAAGAAIVVAVAGFGHLRLECAAPAAAPACTVAAVDASISSGELRLPEVLDRYEAASRAALAPMPAAVVWPESAVPGYPEVDVVLQERLRKLAGGWAVVLIAGGARVSWTSTWQPTVFNSVYRIANSEPIETYDKRMLVPFAESWPLPLVPRPQWLLAQEVAPGTQPRLFRAAQCRLGVLVCFEVEQAVLARESVELGADALLVLSNDAQLPPQAVALELAQARLRAVETGVPVLRAANRGISAAIDRYGRVTEQARGAVLTTTVPPATRAPASWLGPWWLAACWVTSALAVASMLFAQRRRPAGRSGQTLPKLSS